MVNARKKKLEELIKTRADLESKCEDLRQKIDAANKAIQQRSSQITIAENEVRSATSELEKLDYRRDIMPDQAAKLLETERQTQVSIATMTTEIEALRTRHRDLTKTKQQAEKTLLEFEKDRAELLSMNEAAMNARAGAVAAESSSVGIAITGLRPALQDMDKEQAALAAVNARLEKHETSRTQHYNVVVRVLKESPFWATTAEEVRKLLLLESKIAENDWYDSQIYQGLLYRIDSHRLKVNAHSAKIEQQQQIVEQTRARLMAAEQAIEDQKRRRETADSLRNIARLFSRDGIPMAYMRQRFDELVALTEFYLQDLEADFSIRPDPKEAISFEFNRIEPGGIETWFKQDKLSGGQTVRLTIAFLLAVQKLVIPEVGFLVLDEPGLHLDEEGLDALRDTLVRIGESIGDDQQVWVCDHRPNLQTVVQKKIEF
jgi:exonuclease SbcC